jgi:hypothetical protein
METKTITREIEELAARTEGGLDAVLKAVKRMGARDGAALDEMRKALEDLAKKHSRVNLRRFKAEAAEAWKRAFPDGHAKRGLTDYNKFMKEEMPKIKAAMPASSTSDRMKELSRRWNEYKSDRTPEPDEIPNSQPEDDVIMDSQQQPEEGRNSVKRPRRVKKT